MKDFNLSRHDLIRYIPKSLRNDTNKTLIENLFNRYYTRDESVPLYGYVGKKPSSDSALPKISEFTDERTINQLVPFFNFNSGTELECFDSNDLLRKMSLLGGADDLRWLYSQSNNFLPPISLDKFTNFFNYYWIGKPYSVNPDSMPEYYVIEKPLPSSKTKLNVVTSSTQNTILTGSGFHDQIIELVFTSETNFTATMYGGAIGIGPSTSQNFQLSNTSSLNPNIVNDYFTFTVNGLDIVKFKISRSPIFDADLNFIEYEKFNTNDVFNLDIKFLRSIYGSSYTGSSSRPGSLLIESVLSKYQTINGVVLKENDRVLIKDNTASENGIYIVKPGAWVRSEDFDGLNIVSNAEVFCDKTQTLFRSTASGVNVSFSNIGNINNTSEWQEYNYWVSRSEMVKNNISFDTAIQASRPIIEYSSKLQLNQYYQNDKPSDTGTYLKQIKTKFNQIPLFDLFYYDGTHSKKVSGIFFYKEDPSYPVDSVLKRRVKKSTGNSKDFIFSTGVVEKQNGLLFFKSDNELKTVWHPGYTTCTISNKVFSGAGVGDLQISVAGKDAFQYQQIWTFEAISATKFKISGSKSLLPDDLSTIDINQAYENKYFAATITGSFQIGDKFSVQIGNIETPRAVDNNLMSPYEGSSVYQTPRQMLHNVKNDVSNDISEGTLYSHFRGILANQISDNIDGAFGGSIKMWSEPVNLLISLLMQKDVTPVSIMESALRYYETAQNQVLDLFKSNIVQYLQDHPVDVVAITDFILDLRKNDFDYKSVLFDSTSGVIGYPISMAYIGLVSKRRPELQFDNKLGIDVIKKHDGSLIPAFVDSSDFRNSIKNNNGTDYAPLLNSIILEIETRLFNNIPNSKDGLFSGADLQSFAFMPEQMENRFNTWAAKNNLDSTSSFFDKSDAFTYNYSSLGNARWFNVLRSHQAANSKFETARPDLEPWKLLGFVNKPINWQYDYDLSGTDISKSKVTAHTVSLTHINKQGLFTVSGFAVSVGDLVFCINQTDENGLFEVKSGTWVKQNISNKNVLITNGNYIGALFDLDVEKQYIKYNPSVWNAIIDTGYTKMSVNPYTGELLPPFVDINHPASSYAITNNVPNSLSLPFLFGDDGAVETAWKKSTEYLYDVAISYFSVNPLSFLQLFWGTNYIDVNGILVDSNTMMPLTSSTSLFYDISTQARDLTLTSMLGCQNEAIELVMDSVKQSKQYFSIKKNNLIIGTIEEGMLYSSLMRGGITFANLKIEDFGTPFKNNDKFILTANPDGSGLSISFHPSTSVQYYGIAQLFLQNLREINVDVNDQYISNSFKNWDVNLGYRVGGLLSTDDLKVGTDNSLLGSSSYDIVFKKSPYVNDVWAHALKVQVTHYGDYAYTKNKLPMPVGNADNWIFKITNFNARKNDIKYYELDTDKEFVSFNALSSETTDIIWKQYTEVKGIKTASFPLVIQGLQNVITFIHGYVKYLQDKGFDFDTSSNIDASTGRILNWDLEIEKMITAIYGGIKINQGKILSPFMKIFGVKTSTGLLSEFSDSSIFDINVHSAVYDAFGAKIKIQDMDVNRSFESSTVSSNVPVYAAHIQSTEYEHIILLKTAESEVLYDPFSAARIGSLKLNGRKQGTKTLRPEFGGFYLSDWQVRRNLQANTDKINNVYDADYAFEDGVSSKHAMALLGFSKKDYLSNLDMSDKSQFNFWRGLIQMKGTNSSVQAFLNNDRFIGSDLDEFWAFKVAEYGDARKKTYPEIKLSVTDTIQQYTKLNFGNAKPEFINVLPTDESRWFTLDDVGQEISFSAEKYLFTKQDAGIFKLPVYGDRVTVVNGELINASTVKSYGNLQVTIEYARSEANSPIKVINYKAKELVEEIPYWNPIALQNTPLAMSNIDIVSKTNPALYNVNAEEQNSNYDSLRPWAKKEVGRVWWDTSNIDYVPYNDFIIYPDLDDRLNRWGALADYASVDVVQWTESSVHPSAYNAKALEDISSEDANKAEGEVYNPKFYQRDRKFIGRPVAWSTAGVATESAHTGGLIGSRGSFNADYNVRVYFNDSNLVLDQDTFASIKITPGMYFGAFEDTSQYFRPLDEHLLVANTKHLSLAANTANIDSVDYSVGSLDANIEFQFNSSDIWGIFSAEMQPIINTPIVDTDNVLIYHDVKSFISIKIGDNTSSLFVRSDTGTLASSVGASGQNIFGAVFSTKQNQIFTLESNELGLALKIKIGSTGTYSTDALAVLIVNAINSLNASVFDSMSFKTIIPGYYQNIGFLTNDFTDPGYTLKDSISGGIGWRAWSKPSQTQLNRDSSYPNCLYYPIVGDYVDVNGSLDVMNENILYIKKLGIKTNIQQYSNTWSDWKVIKQDVLEYVVLEDEDTEMVIPSIYDRDLISVYVNGTAILRGAYEFESDKIRIFNMKKGFRIVCILKPYFPTKEDLQFDPEIQDNPKILKQYKLDYDFTKISERDSNGNVVFKYYFWVKNKSSKSIKSLSTRGIENALKFGPAQYCIFNNIVDGDYDSIVVSGLSYIVTQDDTFKLRLLQNETLTTDPEGLNFKNVHTEYALIRPGQKSRIPQILWDKLIDSTCGTDIYGNSVPSSTRTNYDLKYGTNTRIGFGKDQTLAESQTIKDTILHTILNTSITQTVDNISIPDYIDFLDFNDSNTWFNTPENTRNTLLKIWNQAKISQINEIFFAVLEDICATNFELSDLFKTSRLSAYNIKVVGSTSGEITFE